MSYKESEYSEAIEVAKTFQREVLLMVNDAETCAKTCVANMEEDTFSKKACDDFNNKLNKIFSIMSDEWNSFIQKMETEKEKAHRLTE